MYRCMQYNLRRSFAVPSMVFFLAYTMLTAESFAGICNDILAAGGKNGDIFYKRGAAVSKLQSSDALSSLSTRTLYFVSTSSRRSGGVLVVKSGKRAKIGAASSGKTDQVTMYRPKSSENVVRDCKGNAKFDEDFKEQVSYRAFRGKFSLGKFVGEDDERRKMDAFEFKYRKVGDERMDCTGTSRPSRGSFKYSFIRSFTGEKSLFYAFLRSLDIGSAQARADAESYLDKTVMMLPYDSTRYNSGKFCIKIRFKEPPSRWDFLRINDLEGVINDDWDGTDFEWKSAR